MKMKAFLFFLMAAIVSTQAVTVFNYSEDFQGTINASEWSSTSTTTIDGSTVLGTFNSNGVVTLNLDSIAIHDSLTINMTFWTTGSTDGNGVPYPGGGTPSNGPDIWRVKADSSLLLESTFSNHRFQNFPDSYSSGLQNAPNTGATKVIGSSSSATVRYDFTFIIEHSSSNLTLEFSDSNFSDEYWSIDDINIAADSSVPEPGSIILFGMILAGLFLKKIKK